MDHRRGHRPDPLSATVRLTVPDTRASVTGRRVTPRTPHFLGWNRRHRAASSLLGGTAVKANLVQAVVLESMPFVLTDIVRETFRDVTTLTTIADATALVRSCCPDVMIVDLDATSFDAFHALLTDPQTLAPAYVVVASDIDPTHAFQLAQLGVRALLKKPLVQAELAEAVRTAIENAPDLTPYLRTVVGHLPIHEIERAARQTMMREALARSHGSKTGAARMLQVSRQLLQHMVRGQKRLC